MDVVLLVISHAFLSFTLTKRPTDQINHMLNAYYKRESSKNICPFLIAAEKIAFLLYYSLQTHRHKDNGKDRQTDILNYSVSTSAVFEWNAFNCWQKKKRHQYCPL